MALFTRTAKLYPGAHGAGCTWAMAVHHAVGISRQRNSGYRPSRVNSMVQGLSTPDPSLSPIHLSIRRGRATTAHYTHHQVSLMVSRNTTIVPSLGLHTGPSCEAGLSAGIWWERVSPQIRKKESPPFTSRRQIGPILQLTWPPCAKIQNKALIKYFPRISHSTSARRLAVLIDVDFWTP